MADSSAYQQTTEVEQKRRKHNLERAKANYLSGQLRLRLQYAKLKVEHGWQRQNLNEVENLYFRHSHRRRPHHTSSPLGSREPSIGEVTATFATTSATPLSSAPTMDLIKMDEPIVHFSNRRSLVSSGSLGLQHGSSSTVSQFVEGSATSSSQEDPVTTAADVVMQDPSSYLSETHIAGLPFQHLALNSRPGSSERTARPGLTRTPSNASQNPGPPAEITITRPSKSPFAAPDPPSTHPQPLGATPVPHSSSHLPQTTASTPPVPARALPSSTPLTPTVPAQYPSGALASAPTLSPSMFSSMGTGSPLTYDSFWSSQASSTSSYRSVLSSNGFNNSSLTGSSPGYSGLGLTRSTSGDAGVAVGAAQSRAPSNLR